MDVLRRRTIAVAALLSACVPDVDVDESRLDAPRLLAVRAEPAEAAPGETVRFVALYAGASGALDEAPLEWAFCVARKPLAELGPVASECLVPGSEALVPIGAGPEASGAIPRDACRLFGPEPPPALPGEPVGRPVDPDVTGGYVQPVGVFVRDGENVRPALFETRIACGLFGATQAQSAEFTQRYRRNAPPSIEALELVRADGRIVALDGEPAEVAAGELVALRVRWPACPEGDACGDGLCGVDETRSSCAEDCAAPAGCGGAERFLRFDLASRSLVVERESIRVAWYASAGELAFERTGVGADEAVTFSENELALPSAPGEVVVIAVLRDARGGVAWREARLRVGP